MEIQLYDGREDIRDEADIGSTVFLADEPPVLGEDAVQNAEDTDDLLLVPDDGTGNVLRCKQQEPARLAVVWSVS